MCSAMEYAMVASVCSGDTDLRKKVLGRNSSLYVCTVPDMVLPLQVFVKVCEGIGALYSVDLWSKLMHLNGYD